MSKNEQIEYIENLSIIISSATLAIFPVFFLPNNTDIFILSKQFLLVGSVIILSLLWGAKTILEKSLKIKSTPFNLPLVLFGVAIFLSAILSRNLYDSLIAGVPVFAAVAFFFLLTNIIDNKNSFNITLSSLVIGTVAASILSILSYFNIYLFPVSSIQNQYFNTFGSPITNIVFLTPVLLFSSLSVFRKYGDGKFKINLGVLAQIVSSLLIISGIIITIYKVVTLPQKPIILPFKYGFQIAITSLSDAGRLFLSFLFGSGYGTFLTDFTRFNTPTFNREPNIWNFAFSLSSSYFLELVATTGIVGVITFIFLIYKIVKSKTQPLSPLYIGLVSTVIFSFLIPFSFPLVFLLFTLLAFYSSYLYLVEDRQVYKTTVALVALKHGLLSFSKPSEGKSAFLPAILLVIIVGIGAFLGFFGGKLFLSDLKFAQSLTPQTLASGEKTYDLQREAIRQFPYKSDYYKIFSQVNMSLANNILSSATANNASPSAETQRTVIQLLQQSINSARAAVTISPLASSNWINLSQIYRNLINVGQNAEQFAIASLQQAIALNPYNPSLYIELGGIYYQLGNFENAQNQFQIAVNLKPDLANAHYNLGHALEAKGDFEAAIREYQTVRELVKNDKPNLEKATSEIESLQAKIGQKVEATEATNVSATEGQPPLELSTPSAQLPPQEPQVKIPGPPATQVRPSPSVTPTPTVETSKPTPNF